MAFKKFIYSTTAAALNKAITAKTVTNDDIAFVNENGVMFIQTQGVKFPCGYSKAEADGRYLKLTGGTLTGTLVLDETNTSNAINFVQNGQYYGYITSSNMYFGAGNDYFLLMCDGLALSASYGESDKYYYGGYGPETINLSEIDTSGSSSRADLFVVDNNGIYKSSGLNTLSILVSPDNGIWFGTNDTGSADNLSWLLKLMMSGVGKYKEMTSKCFGSGALVADNAIDGGYSGYYADGLESSNNNIPVTQFSVDAMGFIIKDRSGSGSTAKHNIVTCLDRYSCITGASDDPTDSGIILSDYGFGFFANYPSDDAFCGLTPTGVKLYGGSSSKILVSNGTMSTLKTINNTSLLGSGNISVLTSHQDISGKSDKTHTHSVKINGVTKTIAATGGTAVDLGTYLTSHLDISGKQDKSTAVTHTANTAVGSATQPVYVNASGVATATTYQLNATVPSGAKFTDTTYSAATTSAAGLMSAADKVKLNGIASGAQVNSITGVKGNAESSYRTGNVNLTPANIGAVASSEKGAKSGVAPLNASGVIDSTYLPSYVDDVLEYSSRSGFPTTGETGKIYVDTSAEENNTYRWSGTQYILIAKNTNTTYKLTKSGSTITLTGSDGATTSVTDSNTTYGVATTSANGLMSSSDKSKLNGIASGAEVNQNTFSRIFAANTTIQASNKTDIVTISGLNVNIGADASNKIVAVSIDKACVTAALGYTPPTTNTTYSTGTSTYSGTTKLYTGTGTATDGTMTQSAINTALSGKANSSHTHTKSLITDFPTSLKNPNALSWSGYSSGSYDGSAAKSITIPNNTNLLTNGAGYITSSGSITGNAATATKVTATVSSTNSAELVRGNMADNDQFRILVGGTASNAGYVEIATADDGSEPIYVRQYTGVFANLSRTATLLDGSGNTSFPGTVTASLFSGNLAGHATSATSATKIGTATVGSTTKPVYINAGTPTAISYALGNACSKTIRTRSSVGNSGWTGLSTDLNYVPDMALIAYWNGAYSGTASNLAYCAKGAFGTFAVKNSLAFSELTNKPTTLSGYGITNALSTSGGTINGELTINTPSGYGIMLNGGMITSEDDGLYIYPSASSGEPYVTIGGGCQVDIDGWTYAPAFVCGNTSNDAQLYMYINGKRYMFNTTALLKSGLLENI